MDRLGHAQLFGFFATMLLVALCKEGRDGSRGEFLAAHGQGIIDAMRVLVRLTVSAAIWFTIFFWASMRFLHVPSRDLFAFMESGTLLQRMAGYCLARSVPALVLSVASLILTSDEAAGTPAELYDLVLFVLRGLLEGLLLPFGFACLLSESAEAGEGGAPRALHARTVATSILGVAFLTFMACGTLSLAV